MIFMTLLVFFKRLMLDFFSDIRKRYRLSKIVSENPTCRFYSSSEIAGSVFGNYVVIFDNNKIYNSKIDSYSYIQVGSRIFNCEIGKFCSIASSVSIAPGIHDLNKVTTHPALIQKSTPLPKVFATRNNIKICEKVFIGHDVWIGEKVVILDGVAIGNGAVIATGAIVIKDVEPYEVVGGVPAKHIKYRFDKQTIEIIQDSQWWNYSDEWFEKNHELMLNMDQFIEFLKCSKK